MSQTFNVTTCATCPLLEIAPLYEDPGCYAPEDYSCRHPLGGVVGGIYDSVRSGRHPPLGCPLRTNELLVRLDRSNDEPTVQGKTTKRP